MIRSEALLSWMGGAALASYVQPSIHGFDSRAWLRAFCSCLDEILITDSKMA